MYFGEIGLGAKLPVSLPCLSVAEAETLNSAHRFS